jgi:hypothetical protein
MFVAWSIRATARTRTMGGDPPTPWSNWSAYSSWVTTTVQAIMASGEQVTYWEPYNEPDTQGYYSSDNFATVTPALLLQQFLVTYQAIKAADPTAAIIGPSLMVWEDYPDEYGSALQEPDMVTFLDFAVANNLQLAAVSWHEIDDSLGPNGPCCRVHPGSDVRLQLAEQH